VPTNDEIKILAFIALGLLILFICLVLHIILSCRKKQDAASTPVTEEGLLQYDNLPPGGAILLAWTESGGNPRWHRKMQDQVREQMPVLARALDRFVDSNS
jgi:hypothetical protein